MPTFGPLGHKIHGTQTYMQTKTFNHIKLKCFKCNKLVDDNEKLRKGFVKPSLQVGYSYSLYYTTWLLLGIRWVLLKTRVKKTRNTSVFSQGSPL